METIKIKYLGEGRKVVELPIPFVSMSEKTGEVVCDPIGEFTMEDGKRLLEIAGADGLWQIVPEVKHEAPKPESYTREQGFKSKAAAASTITHKKLTDVILEERSGLWYIVPSRKPEGTQSPSPETGGKE